MRNGMNFLGISMLILFLILAVSCTRGGNPVDPTVNEDELSELNSLNGDEARTMIGIYSATVDPVSESFTIEPVDRTGSYHVPLSIFPGVISIRSFNFGPPFVADICLSHPCPGSGVDFLDPRIIAVLPARTGVSMNYPSLDLHANNSVLQNPDGYVKLWDIESLSGNANPFVAYFKDYPNRRMSSTGTAFETRTWTMNIAGFGGAMNFYLVVDACTNYPNPSLAGIHNAPEPVEISAEIDTVSGGSGGITVTLLDWQGQSGIGAVCVEAPDLFNGLLNLNYQGPGSNANEYVYSGVISNSKNAVSGNYKLLVSASDLTTGISVYDEFSVTVEQDIVFNPHIVKSVDTPGYTNAVDVANGYAFLADGGTGYFALRIVDIDPLGSASIVKTVPCNGSGVWVQAMGDYALMADETNGLHVISINPISNAQIVNTVGTTPQGFYVSENHVYMTCHNNGFQVVDITSLPNAFVENSISQPSCNWSAVAEGYTYLALYAGGIHIIDTDPIPETHYVTTVTPPGNDSRGIDVQGHYIYVGGGQGGLNIYDISNPEQISLVKTVSLPSWSLGLQVAGNYAYVTAYSSGLQIVDINPPESAHIEASCDTPGQARHVCVKDNYAYVADSWSGLQIIQLW
jgi:hypothetical protein